MKTLNDKRWALIWGLVHFFNFSGLMGISWALVLSHQYIAGGIFLLSALYYIDLMLWRKREGKLG